MDSVEIPAEEFWFYRVYWELTLALLHKVKNELTGALFLTEMIQDDLETGMSIGDKPSDLAASIRKMIQLNQRITDAQTPDGLNPEDAENLADEPGYFLEESFSLLRVLLSSTVALRLEAAPAGFPSISFAKKEVQLILGAVGLLLNPSLPRAFGELTVIFEVAPARLIFLPNYPTVSLIDEAYAEACPGFLALRHRMHRLGGSIEFFRNPVEATHPGLRLCFSKS